MKEGEMDRRAWFESLAAHWDDGVPPGAWAVSVRDGLDRLGPLQGLSVVDAGCGTGLLATHVLERVGPEGRYTGIDYAREMIRRARDKVRDPRASFVARDVELAGVRPGSADVVLCFNAFPHFPDPARVLALFASWLRPGGRVLLWHAGSREEVAARHREAGPPIDRDLPIPAVDAADLCAGAGLRVDVLQDDAAGWLVLARREEAA